MAHVVTKLNDVRDDDTVYNNRLDTTLADVFNLLSLFFLTIGKTKEAPATYSQLASMRVSLRCILELALFGSCSRAYLGKSRTSLHSCVSSQDSATFRGYEVAIHTSEPCAFYCPSYFIWPLPSHMHSKCRAFLARSFPSSYITPWPSTLLNEIDHPQC